MSLTGLNTSWLLGSYGNDRDLMLKAAENNTLRRYGLGLSSDGSGLRVHLDKTGNSLALGYGLDLLVNTNATIQSYLQQANIPLTLTPQMQNLLNQARTTRNQIVTLQG